MYRWRPEALAGGSLNIFYNTINNKGIINTVGGTGGKADSYTYWYYYPGRPIQGGNGGNGTISCGSISTGTYQEYEENVE